MQRSDLRDRFQRASVHAAGVVVALVAWAGPAPAAPTVQPWASQAAGASDAVAAAGLSGWYAVAQAGDDSVEIRDIRQDLQRRITRSEMLALAPWMSLDAGSDGPRALAWTDSGRSLFIVLTDDAPSPDGLGSDAVLRYDTTTDELTRFTRAEIGTGSGPGPAVIHYRGRLWVSTAAGTIRVYSAERNDTAGTLAYSWALPNAEPARGMAVVRGLDLALVVSDTMLYRVDLNQPFAFGQPVGPVTRGRAVAYGEHYGTVGQDGAFVVEGAAAGSDARALFVPKSQITGQFAFAPSSYLVSADDLADASATACGRMLLATAAGPSLLSDSADPRLGYEAWLLDEFEQVGVFAAGLVAPDGQPAGWVTDADVSAGGTRFHPPSPDGAAWVVMMHVAKDHLAGDQASAPIVRDVLRRYAGLMPDGIRPSLTADGITRHWYNPFTGGAAPGWDPEYATLSSMLLVLSADRARRFYGDDAAIVEAADEIIGRVERWDTYIQPFTRNLYLRAQAGGGPDFGTASGPFNEGVLFIEQASVYGSSDAALAYWLDRSALPEAAFVLDYPVTTNWPGGHLPAFVSLYPWLASALFRADPTWETHMRHLLGSHGAWTDDNAPDYLTVFSAGTTKPEWGGYHADSLSDHPGDITTFPSLMAFSALGQTAPSVGAYQAYRRGARQSFATGATMLFRRSAVDPGYTPPDAGLSDVVIGALGLAELIKPGTINAVLAVPYTPSCPADLAPTDGLLDFFDIAAFLAAFSGEQPAADLARPFGQFDFFDVAEYLGAYNAGCP